MRARAFGNWGKSTVSVWTICVLTLKVTLRNRVRGELFCQSGQLLLWLSSHALLQVRGCFQADRSWWLCMCCALCICLKRGEGKEMLPAGKQVIPSRRNEARVVFSRTAEKGCKHASSRWMQPFWSSSSLEGLWPICSQSSQPLPCCSHLFLSQLPWVSGAPGQCCAAADHHSCALSSDSSAVQLLSMLRPITVTPARVWVCKHLFLLLLTRATSCK